MGSGSVFTARTRWLALVAALTAAIVWGATARAPQPDYADASQYIAGAWHLAEHGVFSQATSGPVSPQVGREPGYPAFLSLIVHLDPAWRGYDASCLDRSEGCPQGVYRSAQWANGILIGLAGLALFAAGGMLTGSRLAAWLAGAHIWLNAEAAADRGYLISDYLALLLVAVAALALGLAVRRRTPWAWGIAGLALAALTLTKAVFFYLVVPGLALAAATAAVLWAARRRAAAGLLAVALCGAAYAVPVGAWMARNADVGGAWVLSAGRTATALSTREVFLHMTPAQYAAAFVYWLRGPGDSLAKDLFPEKVWAPFELYAPDGFYMVGQFRVDPMIDSLVAEQGVSRTEAEAVVTRRMIGSILARPLAYVATTLPLFYRGLWVDEFVAVALPALVWLLWTAARRRRFDLLAALTPGVFSLVFYPLVSLNVARYQITALPALALGFGIGLTALWTWWQRRRGTAGASSAAG